MAKETQRQFLSRWKSSLLSRAYPSIAGLNLTTLRIGQCRWIVAFFPNLVLFSTTMRSVACCICANLINLSIWTLRFFLLSQKVQRAMFWCLLLWKLEMCIILRTSADKKTGFWTHEQFCNFLQLSDLTLEVRKLLTAVSLIILHYTFSWFDCKQHAFFLIIANNTLIAIIMPFTIIREQSLLLICLFLFQVFETNTFALDMKPFLASQKRRFVSLPFTLRIT